MNLQSVSFNLNLRSHRVSTYSQCQWHMLRATPYKYYTMQLLHIVLETITYTMRFPGEWSTGVCWRTKDVAGAAGETAWQASAVVIDRDVAKMVGFSVVLHLRERRHEVKGSIWIAYPSMRSYPSMCSGSISEREQLGGAGGVQFISSVWELVGGSPNGGGTGGSKICIKTCFARKKGVSIEGERGRAG
jgi:hypothetical protein